MDRIEKTDKNVTGAIDGGMAAGCVLERGRNEKQVGRTLLWRESVREGEPGGSRSTGTGPGQSGIVKRVQHGE